MTKKSSTIRDVANLAGVSHQTVSRVINNSERVLPETRAKVVAAIQELDYRPNAIARSMALGKTKTLAYIAPNLTDFTFASIIQSAESHLRDLGYSFLITTAESEAGFRGMMNQFVADGRVDGLIVHTPLLEDYQRELLQAVPSVIVGVNPQREGKFTTIDHDNYQISQIAIEHLSSLGHRHIAMIIGVHNEDCVIDRVQGFYDQMNISQRQVHPEWIEKGDWSASSGYQAATRLLTSSRRPSAIYAQNDRMAIGAIHAARDLGFSVPEDLSVIGVDDLPLARHFSPPLTTVRQNFALLGMRAAELLVENLTVESRQRHVRMPAELIVRSTTGPVLH
jgi:DNA-binding LacI/PurR family transcriptional regulator